LCEAPPHAIAKARARKSALDIVRLDDCGKFTQMISWGAYVTLPDLMGSSDGAAKS